MWLKTHQLLVKAMTVGLASLLLLFVAALPIYQNASKILNKVKTRSAELDAVTNKVSILSKLDQNVLQDRMNTMDNALPPRKDILLYLASIDGLSSELGLTLGGLSLTPGNITEATESAKTVSAKTATRKMAGLQSLETEIKMRGNQDNIYTFLRTIETVLPLMQINDIKVGLSGDNELSLSLTLGMLWADAGTADVKGPITLFGAEEDKVFTQLASYRKFDTIAVPMDTTSGKADLFAPMGITPLQ